MPPSESPRSWANAMGTTEAVSKTPGSVRVESLVVAAAAGLVLPVSVLSPKAMAPIFIVACLAALVGILRHGLAWPESLTARLLGAGTVAFLLWSALSALWSITPERSLEISLSNTGTVTGAIVLCLYTAGAGTLAIRRIGTAALAGIAIATILVLVELSTMAALNRLAHGNRLPVEQVSIFRNYLNGSSAVFVMMIWPVTAALGLTGRPKLAAGAGVALFVLSFSAAASVAALAALAGAGAGIIAAFRPRLYHLLFGASVVAAALLMPLVTDILPQPVTSTTEMKVDPSTNHRLRIWNFATERITERPLLGWGLDSSRAIPGGAELVPMLHLREDGKEVTYSEQNLPLHPHNIFLQVWLELGAIGALFTAAALLAVVREVARTEGAVLRFSSAGALAAAIAFSGLSYSPWQSWWLCTMMFALALLGACRGAPGQRKP